MCQLGELCQCFGKDKDVIEIDDDMASGNNVGELCVHECLEGGRRIV